MEIISELGRTLPSLLSWSTLAAVAGGTLIGLVAAALPGFTTSVGLAILLPFTFAMEPEHALLMLIAVNIGGDYGGSIPAILLRIPGEPSNAASIADGNALHQQGKSGAALAMSLFPAAIAVFFASLIFLFFSGSLANLALRFGPVEYFSLFVFAMAAIISLTTGEMSKSMFAVFFGLALAAVGTDGQTAAMRLTFGSDQLRDGLPLVPVVVGLFAVGQILAQSSTPDPGAHRFKLDAVRRMMRLPPLREYKEVRRATGIGLGVGAFFGILPGVGSTVATFVAYSEAKRWSKHPERFGHGSYEGVAAPEAANNTVGPTALIPAFSLGIPGNAGAAMILAALVLHGFRPGPGLLDSAPRLLALTFLAIVLANISMVIFGYLLLPLWVTLVSAPRRVLVPSVIMLVTVGMFSSTGNFFTVWLAFAFGLIGYFMDRYGYPVVATVIAYILGGLIEENFRRAMVQGGGDLSIFVTRPISLGFMLLAVLVVVLARLGFRRSRRATDEARKNDNAAETEVEP